MKDGARVTSQSFARREKKLVFRMPRLVRVIGPANFLWVLALIGVALVLSVKGTPHVLFDYRYQGSKANKTACTYLGIHSRTVAAVNGDCRVIALLRERD